MAAAATVPASAAALRARRLPLLALGFVSLLGGVLAGLARLGLAVPLPHLDLAMLHGPLMVSGFFGTVIALERAAALGRRWIFAGPLTAGLSGALLVAGAPPLLAALLMTVASGVLLAAGVWVWTRQKEGFTATMAGGAACWLVGNALWLLGAPVSAAVLWWALFLVLTIAGERLELSRFQPPNRWAGPAFAAAVAILVLGAAVAVAAPEAGFRVAGLGMLALAGWLARFDVARRTVRGSGLPRYVAACLLSGYAWLAVAGAVALAGADPTGGQYDAVLHALFLGFVFAMVFGHAPIILPAVLRLAVPFAPRLYLPLAALHFGVALRTIGVLSGELAVRQWGGLANAAALALFIVMTAHTVLAKKAPARRIP
ncbi:hypothetical protein [Azospirillum sp.]|uniref:hypothetical protein n=1 Tax=Azospirillum sp. TaxID=34012 RepID=UPI003D75E270